MTDYRFENQYILSFSDKFLKDFDLDQNSFVLWVEKYIQNCYLSNTPQLYSVKIWGTIIRFHKIDIENNNQSWQKAKRAILFFLLNVPEGKNTLYPAFAFSTQEEKIYNSKLKTPEFVKSLRLKLERYNGNNEHNVVLELAFP